MSLSTAGVCVLQGAAGVSCFLLCGQLSDQFPGQHRPTTCSKASFSNSVMAVDPPKKRGRPSKIPSPQIGEEDVAAGLKGKAVIVPSSALAALTSVHGPDTYLHGQIKVISGLGPFLLVVSRNSW